MNSDLSMDVGRAEWDALMAVRHLRSEVNALPRQDRIQAVDHKAIDDLLSEFFGLLGDLSIDRQQAALRRAREAA